MKDGRRRSGVIVIVVDNGTDQQAVSAVRPTVLACGDEE